MRAGAFSERRVTRLLNRRFISFFFNTGGPGLGHDDEARDFVSRHAEPVPEYNDRNFLKDRNGGLSNLAAYYAAFEVDESVDGTSQLLGLASSFQAGQKEFPLEDLYPDKDRVFRFLVQLLRDHPEFNRYTSAEQEILRRANDANGQTIDVAACLQAGQLEMDLGNYEEARAYFQRVVGGSQDSDQTSSAFRDLMRIARYAKNRDQLRDIVSQIRQREDFSELGLEADIELELAYRDLDSKEYQKVRDRLVAAIENHPHSKRMGELQYYAGIACYFLQDKDRAYYHWCWIVENIPDDHLARRAYITAAHEDFPYPNSELDNFRSERMIGVENITQAYERAREVYERLSR